jgi:hypothetical protein
MPHEWYHRRSAPSVKYQPCMLKSCDNRPDEGEDVPHACRVQPSVARRHSHPPDMFSVGLGGQGDVRSKKRGEVTLIRAPDLETDLAEGHVGIGQ